MTETGDSLGAFCLHAKNLCVPGKAEGPLAGLTFAVKDLIDVKGISTGAGNPDWLASQSPAEDHGWVVSRLLKSGATLTGKTVTDELAFSLTGRNVHYGTPVNPAVPDRMPGGSSSGSASAVAAGVVDFAIGTDTGGSVRVPASYCGIYGIRPTHGRIPLDGVVRFAPSFDTIGWFTRSAGLLQRIGRCLLHMSTVPSQPTKVLRVDDAFLRAEPETRAACDALLKGIGDRMLELDNVEVCSTRLDDWMTVFRTLRSVEVWENKGPWIESTQPRFGPEIARNFAAAARITKGDAARMQPLRQSVSRRMSELVGNGALLALPTTPEAAPARDSSYRELDRVRDRIQSLTCIAGLAGLPQVNIPAGAIGGAPVGLSLIAAAGDDEQLLEFARRVAEAEPDFNGGALNAT